MSDVNEAWRKAQRARWLRPNGHLYVRADAWRLAPPGTPEAKPPGWLDPSMTRVRWQEAQEEEARAAFEAEVKAAQATQDRLWAMLAEIKYELAWRKLCRKYGYDPDQPRDELGRWTDAGGGASTDASEEGAGSDSGDMGADAGDAAPNGNSLSQELRRFPASDQSPRSDRRELDAIANDPLIRAYMDEAWIASNPYGIYPNEHGFWISRDEVSGQLFTRPFATSGVGNIIDPGPPPPDAIAFFHTHPYGGIQLGAAPPNFRDEAVAARLGLPGLIQSHVGVYYFGPPLRPVR